MLAQLIYRLGLFKLFEKIKIIVYTNICNTHLKLKKCLIYVTLKELWKLNGTCNILPELQNLEFGWLWKRWGRRVSVDSRTFKCEGERNDNMLHYEQVFGNVFERRKSKCCAVLMKHHGKVKGEQVITFQMVQQLRTKNITKIPR